MKEIDEEINMKMTGLPSRGNKHRRGSGRGSEVWERNKFEQNLQSKTDIKENWRENTIKTEQFNISNFKKEDFKKENWRAYSREELENEKVISLKPCKENQSIDFSESVNKKKSQEVKNKIEDKEDKEDTFYNLYEERNKEKE